MLLVALMVIGCSSDKKEPRYVQQAPQPVHQPPVQQYHEPEPEPERVEQYDATYSFSLRSLLAIVKNCKNAEGLERRINGFSGINNLDLNHDGNIDFVMVNGLRGGHGFSFTTEPYQGEIQSIAEVEIYKDGGYVDIVVRGNPELYPYKRTYSTRYRTSNFLLWAYLLTPNRVYYSSSYGYNTYPTYYSNRTIVSRDVYVNKTTVIHKKIVINKTVKSKYKKSKLKNRYRGKSSANYKKNKKKYRQNKSKVTKSKVSDFHKKNKLSNPKHTAKKFKVNTKDKSKIGKWKIKNKGNVQTNKIHKNNKLVKKPVKRYNKKTNFGSKKKKRTYSSSHKKTKKSTSSRSKKKKKY